MTGCCYLSCELTLEREEAGSAELFGDQSMFRDIGRSRVQTTSDDLKLLQERSFKMGVSTSGDLYESTKREVVTDKGVLRYHEAGEGPPLLLLHGSGIGVSGWRNYRGNLEVFAEHFHCYILEFPGFGISDPVGGQPMMTAASSVVRFMKVLNIESAAIIGNSMGGIVGAHVAMTHPHLVTKLVTIGGVGPNIFSQNPSEGTRLLQEFADGPSREKLVRWLNCMVYDPAVITDERIDERWEASSDPASHESLSAMYGSKAIEERQRSSRNSDTPPYWSMLHKVKCATLLTWGRDDRQCPPDMPMLPMRYIPNAELHIFPNCGHWVMIEVACPR